MSLAQFVSVGYKKAAVDEVSYQATICLPSLARQELINLVSSFNSNPINQYLRNMLAGLLLLTTDGKKKLLGEFSSSKSLDKQFCAWRSLS